MKIIIASYPKTGTKSLVAALIELNYNVYDVMEHFRYHGDQWMKIYTQGGDIEDFRRMYENVDVLADTPACLFWEEIHQAFPESKIILTMRPEDEWLKSKMKQIQKFKDNTTWKLMQYLSPLGWKFSDYLRNCKYITLGVRYTDPFHLLINPMMLKQCYRQHQRYCKQNAPKDKLLVYNIKDGWDPLCKFLGINVPDKPFPYKNVGGEILEQLMANDPTMLRMQKESILTVATILSFTACGLYYLYRNTR